MEFFRQFEMCSCALDMRGYSESDCTYSLPTIFIHIAQMEHQRSGNWLGVAKDLLI